MLGVVVNGTVNQTLGLPREVNLTFATLGTKPYAHIGISVLTVTDPPESGAIGPTQDDETEVEKVAPDNEMS
jgi:hypothetical protein